MDDEKELAEALKMLTGNLQQVYTQNAEIQKQFIKEKKKNIGLIFAIGFLAGVLIIAIIAGYVFNYKQFDRMATAFENQEISVENSYTVPDNNNTNINNNGALTASSEGGDE